MCRLISRGRTRAEKGSYTLSWQDVYEFNEDLIAGVAAPKSGVVNREQFLSDLNQFREVFDDRAYLLGEAHRSVDDFSALEHFEKLSRETKLPLVATGNVHYHIAERMLVHDCVTAIRNGTTISRITEGGFSNSQYHLRGLSELKGIYGSFPDAIARTEEIRADVNSLLMSFAMNILKNLLLMESHNLSTSKDSHGKVRKVVGQMEYRNRSLIC